MTKISVQQTFLFIGIILIISSLAACENNNFRYTTKLKPTQGVLTELKEVRVNVFKIVKETIVSKTYDSKTIITYLDGKKDTFNLYDARLSDHNVPRNVLIRKTARCGLLGYLSGRDMNEPIVRSAYKSDTTYRSSRVVFDILRSTASRNKTQTRSTTPNYTRRRTQPTRRVYTSPKKKYSGSSPTYKSSNSYTKSYNSSSSSSRTRTYHNSSSRHRSSATSSSIGRSRSGFGSSRSARSSGG